MLRLYLIRHGETNFNKNYRYCGITDPPLNKKGISQAKKLARQLKNTPIDLVYVSPLRRADQTAQIIFNRKLKIITAPALREINFGRWEGLNYNEVMVKYQSRLKKWLLNPWAVCPPGGENLKRFRKRILFFLKKYILPQRKKGIENIALVTHGGVIKIIYSDFKKNRSHDFWSFNPLPGSLLVLKRKV
ncbi:MAG: alpha-ribazole phosphatase [Planctomycetota bacterium]